MRKLTWGLALAGLLSLHAATASAQGGYGMAGCGLGSLVFQNDNAMIKQVLAATTNGTFGSQTFGITSGTSNCTAGGVLKSEKEQMAFVEVNFRDLKRDMAAGGGEFLSSFGTLLGCEEAAKPALAKMTQNKYETLVPSETTTPVQLLSTLKTQMKATPVLAQGCSDQRAIARAQGKGDKTAPVKVATAAAKVK
jgi:hypothetical protein